jgi:nitrogen fixation NifU-like protein
MKIIDTFNIQAEGGGMNEEHAVGFKNSDSVREMLSGSGYSQQAIDYYIHQPNMGRLIDADLASELTGPCGDTMKVYLSMTNGCIKDGRFQVMGCPGAVAAAMAVVDLVRGKTLDAAMALKDRDVFRKLESIPEQKQHCIRLAVKTLQKAITEYRETEGR